MSRLGGMAGAVAPGATTTWRLFRRLETGPARTAFLRRLWARSFLGRQDRLPATLGATPLILFVCHGNIMRSALAEVALARASGSRVRVASAGTAASPGREADPRTVAYAATAGLDLRRHRARLLDLEAARGSDLIFALDRRIEAEVVALDPGLEARTFLLGGITPAGGYAGHDIDDPYSLLPERTTQSFDQVMKSIGVLAERMR